MIGSGVVRLACLRFLCLVRQESLFSAQLGSVQLGPAVPWKRAESATTGVNLKETDWWGTQVILSDPGIKQPLNKTTHRIPGFFFFPL